jgi:hypothetical protein
LSEWWSTFGVLLTFQIFIWANFLCQISIMLKLGDIFFWRKPRRHFLNGQNMKHAQHPWTARGPRSIEVRSSIPPLRRSLARCRPVAQGPNGSARAHQWRQRPAPREDWRSTRCARQIWSSDRVLSGARCVRGRAAGRLAMRPREIGARHGRGRPLRRLGGLPRCRTIKSAPPPWSDCGRRESRNTSTSEWCVVLITVAENRRGSSSPKSTCRSPVPFRWNTRARSAD